MKRLNPIYLAVFFVGLLGIFGCGQQQENERVFSSPVILSFSYETGAGATATVEVLADLPDGTCDLVCRGNNQREVVSSFTCKAGKNVVGVYSSDFGYDDYECTALYTSEQTVVTRASNTATFGTKYSWITVSSFERLGDSILIHYITSADPNWGPNDKFEYATAYCFDVVGSSPAYESIGMGISGVIEIPADPNKSYTCFLGSSFEHPDVSPPFPVITLSGWYNLPTVF